MKRQLGLNNVQFLGEVTLDEVHSALSSARLFLNTSLTEGSPTAALEAMACGLPVVLTPANDYSAIVEQGINGMVIGSWSAEELAGAIDELLIDRGRLKSAGEAARRTAAAHSWDAKARFVTEAMISAIQRRISGSQ
jgi:glycosyltransferase involved in cell wall biosynthesis